MYLAFFPSPACAFFDFLLTVGISDVTNREAVDLRAPGVIVESDTPSTDVLAVRVADVASNASAKVGNPVATCTRPHNGAVSAGDGLGSANMDGIDPAIEVD